MLSNYCNCMHHVAPSLLIDVSPNCVSRTLSNDVKSVDREIFYCNFTFIEQY